MSVASAVQDVEVWTLDLSGFVEAEEGMTVSEVVRRMQHCGGHAALIMCGDRLCGIFTKRDVTHKVADQPAFWERPVRDFMTREPVVIPPRASLMEALRRMNSGQFRDLPVVDPSGRVVGNLTDSVIVQRLGECLQAEVLNLPPDPDQVTDTVEGA